MPCGAWGGHTAVSSPAAVSGRDCVSVRSCAWELGNSCRRWWGLRIGRRQAATGQIELGEAHQWAPAVWALRAGTLSGSAVVLIAACRGSAVNRIVALDGLAAGIGQRSEQLLGAAEPGVHVAWRKQPVMADLEELVRQDVQEEAADELLGCE